MDWKAIILGAYPQADAKITKAFADHATADFAKWKINTSLRQAHLLAHIAVESAFFKTIEENLSYSALRMCQVWPSRFKTVADVTPYARNPKALANKVYGGRLGNVNPDDGWTFRGQGLLQTTGRANVAKLAKALNITPEVAALWLVSPDHMVECAAANFILNGAIAPADRNDIIGSTKAVNGGLNGLDDRKLALARFRKLLGA